MELTTITKYPTGELQVNVGRKGLHGQTCDVTLYEATSDAIMALLLECDAIKNNGGALGNLNIKFFPYARQDRVCNGGEAFSLRVMAKLINDLGFEKVIVTEPHSNVLGALVNNLVVRHLAHMLKDLPQNKTIIAPDAGAEKRAFEVAKLYKRPLVTAAKRRDPNTGAIVKTEVFCEDLEGADCLIVDDICDGGRTFIELGKVLKAKQAGKVTLVVAHGIFSQGVDALKGPIDEVYCLDRFNELAKMDFF